MADELKDAKDGLKTRLETISGLRIYDHVPDSGPNEYPAAVLQFLDRTARSSGTLGGSHFEGRMSLTLLISKANDLEAYDELDKYMSPLGTLSIEAAVDGDNTWGGNVDAGYLESVEDIRHQEMPWGGRYVAANFVFGFLKQVDS